MNNTDRQNNAFTMNKLLVDSLAEDGVICSSFNKNYDEQATYEGGTGERRRFTLKNNDITSYHQVLKILTGEWRANIHEAIPAIDFLNKENTGIMNTYLVENGKVHPDTIVSIPSSNSSDVLQDIVDDDPYTINRAIAGEEVAEHFYNSTGAMAQPNCLVSPPSESLTNFAYVYKGIKNKSITVYDSDGTSYPSASVRLDKISFLAPRIGETCTVGFDPDTSVIHSAVSTDAWGNTGVTDEYGTLILQKGFVDAENGNAFVTEDDNPVAANSALAKLLASVVSTEELSLAITLNNGDFALILPGSLTSLDSTKVLVFKKDYINGGYKLFVAYATSVSYSTEPTPVDVGEALPAIPDGTEEGIVIDSSILDSVDSYIAIEREYYSAASGLLCGAFSEPAEVTNLGGSKVITKWKFINDADIAARKGAAIPVGSKLYPNYLLGRGSIKDAPLATNEAGYDGLSAWIYDTIGNKITDVFHKYETNTSTWSALSEARLSRVLTKETWSNNRATDVANPKKFKTSSGRAIGFDEIESYVSKASRSLKVENDGSYTIVLDRSDPFVEYSHRVIQNSGVFDWGWVKTTGDWRGNGAEGNTLGTDYRHLYRLQWSCRKKKSGRVISNHVNMSVKVMSPYQAYKPAGLPDGTPYMLWPSEKTVFPAKLFIFTRTPLDVTLGENGQNTICFYNDEADKSVMFEVTGITEFPASKIRAVSWYNDEIHGWDRAEASLLTTEVSLVDNAASHDCYVYTLENLSVDLDNIEFKDTAGNKVAEIPNLRASVVPFSYPKSYFKCDISRGTDGSFRYLLKTPAAIRDLTFLQNSLIIPGMPPVNSLLNDNTAGVPSHKLSAFRGVQKLFSAGSSYSTARSSLIKDSLYNILYNRPVSEKKGITDTGEVIVLGEIPELVNGLKTLSPYISNIIDSGFTTDGKKLTTSDFNSFYKRLESFEEVLPSPDFALDYTPVTADTVINGKSLEKFIEDRLPTTTGAYDKTLLNDIFRDAVQLATTTSVKIKHTGTSSPAKKPRPSLTVLGNTLTHIFSTSSNSEITREDCVALDNYFGNNTKAFLITREDVTNDVIPEKTASLAESIAEVYSEIIAAVDDVFRNTVKERETTSIVAGKEPDAFANYNSNLAQLKTDITNIYKTSFVPSSIVIDGTIQPTVKVAKLVLDPSKTRADFEALKNSPDRFVRSQYGWSWNYSYSTGGNIFVRAARNVANQAFYLSFKTIFGKSAWDTCDTAMRTWPTLSLDSFIQRYQLDRITSVGLSSSDTRIHDYLIDTVATNRRSKAAAEASTLSSQKVAQLIKQQAALVEAKAEAVEYVNRNYVELTSEPSSLVNTSLLGWVTKSLYLAKSKLNKSGYIHDWLDTVGPSVTGLTRYKKVDNTFVQDTSGAYVNSSQLASSYSSYYTHLLDNGYLRGDQKTISLPLPVYSSDKSHLEDSSLSVSFTLPPYEIDKLDIENSLLTSIATYVRTALEGTSVKGTENYFVKFEPNDEDVSGRSDSLYYERYLYLNARMNRSNGTLFRAAQFDQSRKFSLVSNHIEDQLKATNKKYFTVVPVEWANELAYFKPQMLEKMNTYFPGKFYYKQQLLDIAQQINGRCMLTCGYCPVKDTCPFYGEDEVLKMACTSAPSIDLYVKDNVPDLLYYSEGEITADGSVINRSPSIYYSEGDDGSREEFDHELLKSFSKPYASIAKKTQATRDENGDLIYTSDSSSLYRDLTTLEEDTKKAISGLNLANEMPTGLGWLTGGRWGTLQRNKLAEKNTGFVNEEYPAECFPRNKYYYDAVFLNDEETEVLYSPSQNWYDVDVTTSVNADSDGTPKNYKGKTRIQIPTALKAFAERPDGDVYLVSDDYADDQGNPITPVIYLGAVQDIRYAFDLREEGSNQDEVTSSSDTRLYPKDVAQWSINMAKGNCTWDIIDPDSFVKANTGKEAVSQGYDQYWMEKLKKRVTVNGEERIVEIDGRPRRNAGYSEVVLDPDHMNEYEVISGRPVAARRVDFLRKISFRILDGTASDTNDGYGLIPWCKEPGNPERKTEDALYVDVQKSVLPFMKTNLRLVICEVEH